MAANIIGIKNIDINEISKKDIFAVDTNVLVWTHYSKASDANLRVHPYQVTDYPNFIARLLNNGNKLVATCLNLSELCIVIERNEYRIFKALNGLGRSYGIKDFRKNISARANYKYELEYMLTEIKETYGNDMEIVKVDSTIIKEFTDDIIHNNCDVFDYAIIQHLKKMGIKNYISDDKDFSTVDGINLYCSSGN